MEKQVLFETKGIGKTYGTNTVLQDIDMQIYPGEIIGLIGENGAGKSTLLKIISGVERASAGNMYINSQQYIGGSPVIANNMGIGMVFQEQSLIRNLTVAQNIFLGKEYQYRHIGIVNWSKMEHDAKAVLEEIGINNIKPSELVMNLSFAARQMVEIAKIFNIVSKSPGKSIILLDEPTSVLNDVEIKQLFEQIRKIVSQGNSVVFVSHRLDEVMEISDRIYIFKDGKQVGMMEKKDANEAILYEKMVGRNTTGEYYKVNKQTVPDMDKELLKVENLSKFGVFKDISFSLHAGEVLGICGVEGSGKEELCDILVGEDHATSGEIFVKGQNINIKNQSIALNNGILSIPKERRTQGMIGTLSVKENMMLSSLNKISKFGILPKSSQDEVAKKWIDTLAIKTNGANEMMLHLSGGNAQKVVFARAINSEAEILILNHPTRGVDIGSKEEIYDLIRTITNKGMAVILLGDTLDESIGISSKIIALKDGLISGVFDCSADNKPDQVDIVKCML